MCRSSSANTVAHNPSIPVVIVACGAMPREQICSSMRRRHSARIHILLLSLMQTNFGQKHAPEFVPDHEERVFMKMNVRTIFGLAAVAGLLAVAVPTGGAQALSLMNPAASSSARQASEPMTTQVHWRRHHHHRWHRHHGWRRHHGWHHHHGWRHHRRHHWY
ncbi:MAG: hypothetical protein ACJAVZ_000621 [Afipia broomeae]|jgi:hypothetical protein